MDLSSAWPPNRPGARRCHCRRGSSVDRLLLRLASGADPSPSVGVGACSEQSGRPSFQGSLLGRGESEDRVSGRAVLVTGAARGIGLRRGPCLRRAGRPSVGRRKVRWWVAFESLGAGPPGPGHVAACRPNSRTPSAVRRTADEAAADARP